MDLAAVVMVPEKDFAALSEPWPHALTPAKISRPLYSSLLPILGNDVLRTWTSRVHKLGVQSLWLTSSRSEESEAWSTLDGFAKQGIERFLMIKLKSYAEMDLADLLRFHCESRSQVTEVLDSRGQLGVSVLDRLALPSVRKKRESYCIPTKGKHTPYPFCGYAKRILSASERQELVRDGLTGACAMRPLGKEIRDQVWVGEGVSLANSAKIIGPAYIGDRTIVRAGATIGPYASVERDSLVDCGTALERSTVLPGTHVAPGLLIRHALVDGRHLENLACGVVVDLQPGGLASRMRRREPALKTSSDADTDMFSPTVGYAWDSAPPPEWRKVKL